MSVLRVDCSPGDDFKIFKSKLFLNTLRCLNLYRYFRLYKCVTKQTWLKIIAGEAIECKVHAIVVILPTDLVTILIKGGLSTQ